MPGSGTRIRSSVTGSFVPPKQTTTNPRATEAESVRKPTRKTCGSRVEPRSFAGLSVQTSTDRWRRPIALDMDDRELQNEYDREDEETRGAILGNAEARGIVDGLMARWSEFTSLPLNPDHLNTVYEAVLWRVDAGLSDGTPRAQIPALAERWFRDELKRLQG